MQGQHGKRMLNRKHLLASGSPGPKFHVTQVKPLCHLLMMLLSLYYHLHTPMFRHLFLMAFAKAVYQLMFKHMYVILMNC
jgi:hypothetical protein